MLLSILGRAVLDDLAALEMLRQAGKREGIEHAVGGHAAFARHFHTPMRQIEFVGGMRVGIDAHHTAEGQRPAMPAPVQIEPPRIGVETCCRRANKFPRALRGKFPADFDVVTA